MFALFEDRLAPPGEPAGWLLTGLCRQHAGTVADLAVWLAAARRNGEWVALALDYEAGAQYEPAAGAFSVSEPLAQPCRLWVFADCARLDAGAVEAFLAAQLNALPVAARSAGVGGLRAGWSRDEHAAAVQAVQDYIQAGDCYQVNLTFPLHCTAYGHPLALYAALRQQQPARYGALMPDPACTLVSLSPELFVQRRGNELCTRPMKGTAPRASDADEDAALAAALQASAKNRAENLMIVDLLRNDLSRLGQGAATLQVDTPRLFELEAYPSVWQMVSQVEARLLSGSASCLALEQVLPALFPCGSITGAPKIRAMQIIRELESGPRGIYTGTLGWQAPDGDFRLNVAIRTLALKPAGPLAWHGTLGVGGGIVQDSEAAAEWAESWLKARFLSTLDSGLELIETFCLEVPDKGAACYHRLPAHLARLAASAHWLGFVCDRTAIEQALAGLATGCASGNWRVRLGLRKNGSISLRHAVLEPEPAGPRSVLLAREPVDSSHPLQGHKTSWRAHYDTALAEIAGRPEIFDVLFFNERDELVEGARSSVFVRLPEGWFTPPLSAGALPGIWRAAVLAGACAEIPAARERALKRADLLAAEAVICGNSLRGAVPVQVAPQPQ